jgi:hypothetical protein
MDSLSPSPLALISTADKRLHCRIHKGILLEEAWGVLLRRCAARRWRLAPLAASAP